MRNYIQIGLFLAATLLGCSRVRQADEPTPRPLPATLPQINFGLVRDTATTFSFRLDSLVADRTQPYTLTFSQPALGRLVLEGDQLRYHPGASRWSEDAATYTICQAGACSTGKLRFVNQVQYVGCVQQSTINRLTTFLGSFDLAVIPANVNGIFTELRAENYTVSALADGKTITYVAAGARESYGYDVISYRYTIGADCFEGTINVVLGDTCQPGVRPLSVPAAALATFIPRSALVAVSSGCRGQVATADSIRLDLARSPRKATPYGAISDTIIGSQPGLYYRRGVPGVVDSTYYYYKDPSDQRITRAVLRLLP